MKVMHKRSELWHRRSSAAGRIYRKYPQNILLGDQSSYIDDRSTKVLYLHSFRTDHCVLTFSTEIIDMHDDVVMV